MSDSSQLRYYRKNRDDINRKRDLYRQTPKGKAAMMWTNITARAENRNGTNPQYTYVKVLMTREEFIEWAVKELEKFSVLDNLSIDRKQNDGHYEISNLQLLSLDDNRRKQGKNYFAPSGYVWCSKCKDYLLENKFHKNSTSVSGFQSFCKECRHERRKIHSR